MNDPIAQEIGEAAERLARRMAKGAQRVVIAGGPRTGKSTLAETVQALFGGKLYATDALIKSHDWSGISEACSTWMIETPGPWIVEGVAAVRALRKYMERRAAGRPCELVIWMSESRVHRTPGQISMAKGCTTVWNEIVGKLLDRGVLIEEN